MLKKELCWRVKVRVRITNFDRYLNNFLYADDTDISRTSEFRKLFHEIDTLDDSPEKEFSVGKAFFLSLYLISPSDVYMYQPISANI